jgi:hypothetical protein
MHARKLQQMYQRTRIPMPIIAEIAQAMQEVLTNEAKRAGRTSGFVQRVSKFDGAALAQTLVFSYLARGTNCWTSTPRNYWTTLNPFQTRQNTTIIKV